MENSPGRGIFQEGILEGLRGIKKPQRPGWRWVKAYLAGSWARGVKAPKIGWRHFWKAKSSIPQAKERCEGFGFLLLFCCCCYLFESISMMLTEWDIWESTLCSIKEIILQNQVNYSWEFWQTGCSYQNLLNGIFEKSGRPRKTAGSSEKEEMTQMSLLKGSS